MSKVLNSERPKYVARFFRQYFANQGVAFFECKGQPVNELQVVYDTIDRMVPTKREEIIDTFILKCNLQNDRDLAGRLVTEKLKKLLKQNKIERVSTGFYLRK